MISTSFLRTLNVKKYQDFTTETKNRLKVFYARSLSRMNKETLANQRLHSGNKNPCLCKSKLALLPDKQVQSKKTPPENKKSRPQITTNNILFHLQHADLSLELEKQYAQSRKFSRERRILRSIQEGSESRQREGPR